MDFIVLFFIVASGAFPPAVLCGDSLYWAGGVSGNIFWGSVGVEEAWQIKVNLDIFFKNQNGSFELHKTFQTTFNENRHKLPRHKSQI